MVRIPDMTAHRSLLLCGVAIFLPLAAQAQGVSSSASPSASMPTSSLNGGLGIGVPQNTALGNGLVNLRDLVDSPALGPAPTADQSRQIQFNASIGAFAGYTDNANLSGGSTNTRMRGSPEEHITPTIGVTADTSRLQGNAYYSPDFRIFNNDPNATRVAQSLAAHATAKLIDDSVFLNTSALATQATNSMLSTYNASNLSTTQVMSQVYSYSINPYFVHNFGDVATVKASYQYSGSYFDNKYFNNATNLKNSTSATQTEDLLVTSGADYQLLNHSVEASASQFIGTGSERNGYRNMATYTANYALNHAITLIGMVGVESLHYSAVTSGSSIISKAYNVNGPVGQGGVKYAPTEDGQISVLYGHMDGGNSLTVNGSLRAGAHLSLQAMSATGLTTNGQDLQSMTDAATVGPDGTLTNGASGSPLRYSLGSGSQDNQLYRLTRSSVSAIYALDRDSFSATFSSNQSQNVAQSTTPGLASTSVLGSLGWQHQLTEAVSTSVSGSYGSTRYSGNNAGLSGARPMTGASVRLSDQLTETLSAELDYNYTRQRAYNSNLMQHANEILAGLVQKF